MTADRTDHQIHGGEISRRLALTESDHIGHRHRAPLPDKCIDDLEFGRGGNTDLSNGGIKRGAATVGQQRFDRLRKNAGLNQIQRLAQVCQCRVIIQRLCCLQNQRRLQSQPGLGQHRSGDCD